MAVSLAINPDQEEFFPDWRDAHIPWLGYLRRVEDDHVPWQDTGLWDWFRHRQGKNFFRHHIHKYTGKVTALLGEVVELTQLANPASGTSMTTSAEPARSIRRM